MKAAHTMLSVPVSTQATMVSVPATRCFDWRAAALRPYNTVQMTAFYSVLPLTRAPRQLARPTEAANPTH
jgi:hypothetical protein